MMYSELTRSKASSASLPSSGTFVLCGLSVPAHAQIATTDAASLAKLAEQYIQQGEQYAKQIDQYIQQVKNANGLGDVLKDITGDDRAKVDSRKQDVNYDRVRSNSNRLNGL